MQPSGVLLNTTSVLKFLEVTIDRTLSFGPNVGAVVSKASNRCRALASLTSKSWGWSKDQLLKVYQALHLSDMNYAAPAWQPWLAPTRLNQLERCQNRALRIITGQLKTTPLEALWIEVGVASIATQAKPTSCRGLREGSSSPNESPSQNTASRAVSSSPQMTKLALYGQDPNKQIARCLVLRRRPPNTP